MIKLLLISSLFPNSRNLQHGIFVETRLRKLLASGQVEARVIAPVPWFPKLLRGVTRFKLFAHYVRYIDVPSAEVLQGVRVDHPKYLVIPKVGMLLTPVFMALSILWCLRITCRSDYECDLIDAHYFYPDGVAVALVSKWLRRPLVISARGTDINVIPDAWLPRQMILWAAKCAAASVTVSQALAQRMTDLGAETGKLHVMRNGVDLKLFDSKGYRAMRRRWAMTGVTLLSVGNLVEAKGHGLVIEALAALPHVSLIVAGDGVLRQTLEQQAASLRLTERVRFVGSLTQVELVELYSAADALVLASRSEGCANVLLEAMACGAPVVAVAVGGTPEVVTHHSAGVLVAKRSLQELVDGITCLLANPPGRETTRRYAETYSWQPTIEGLVALYTRLTPTSTKEQRRRA